MHFAVKTIIQAIPKRRAVPFRRLANAVHGDDEIIVIFRRIDIAQIWIAAVFSCFGIIHGLHGFSEHIEDITRAVLYRPAPDDVLHDFVVIPDVPVVVSQRLHGRVIIFGFYIFVLSLGKSVMIIGGDATPGFVEAFATKVIFAKLVSILRVIIRQPDNKLPRLPALELN